MAQLLEAHFLGTLFHIILIHLISLIFVNNKPLVKNVRKHSFLNIHSDVATCKFSSHSNFALCCLLESTQKLSVCTFDDGI